MALTRVKGTMSIIDSSDPIPAGFEAAEFVVRAIASSD